MPDASNPCDGTCPPINFPFSSSEDESSCDESDMEFTIDGTCRTVEVCGTRDVLDLTTGRTTHVIEVCSPRCPDETTIWNAETQHCDPIIPPLSCEDKLIPHIDRESEVETRYYLQQTIMTEQNERHLRQMSRMERLNLRKWRQDERQDLQNSFTIALTNRETILTNKFNMLEMRRINLSTAWSLFYVQQEMELEIIRQEEEMVITRERHITEHEITVVETIRILAEDLGVCAMPDEA
jgi:hypothetical protein